MGPALVSGTPYLRGEGTRNARRLCDVTRRSGFWDGNWLGNAERAGQFGDMFGSFNAFVCRGGRCAQTFRSPPQCPRRARCLLFGPLQRCA